MCDVHTKSAERREGAAMAGNNEAAEFSMKVERGSFDKASCAVGQVKEALEYKWALSSSKKDTEAESYCSSKFLADAGPNGGEQKKALAKVGYSIPAAEEIAGVYAQKNVMAEESYGNGRFLLSCSMASTRVKKKRRSRATSKAPIKVFSTDASNFMAMVHKLTGIPSNTFPFYSPPPLPASSKLSPFTQGLPTLDTSAVLLSCDRFSSGGGGGAYSGLQALPSQQLFSSLGSELKTSNQSAQSVANIDSTSLSYSDLMRNMCSGSPSNLPRLWEASHLKHKSVPHKQQENCISESEGIARHEGVQQGMTKESNAPISSKLSSLEILLAAQDKLASSDAWVPSTSLLTSSMAKEELL